MGCKEEIHSGSLTPILFGRERIHKDNTEPPCEKTNRLCLVTTILVSFCMTGTYNKRKEKDQTEGREEKWQPPREEAS